MVYGKSATSAQTDGDGQWRADRYTQDSPDEINNRLSIDLIQIVLCPSLLFMFTLEHHYNKRFQICF